MKLAAERCLFLQLSHTNFVSRGILACVSDSHLHDRLHTVAAGRSLRHLGELTQTNPETVRRYMNGQPPSADFLVALCHSLGVNAQWLLTGQGPMLQSDVKGHVLKAANATDLLTAMAETIERLIDRVGRIERFMQALDVRVLAVDELARAASEDQNHVTQESTRGVAEIKPGDPSGRAALVADAIRRSSDGA